MVLSSSVSFSCCGQMRCRSGSLSNGCRSDLAMNQWTPFNGASCGPGRCALIVRPKAEYYDGPISAIVCWDEATGFDITVVPVRLDSIVVLDDHAASIVCMAQLGTIVTLADGQLTAAERSPDGSARHRK